MTNFTNTVTSIEKIIIGFQKGDSSNLVELENEIEDKISSQVSNSINLAFTVSLYWFICKPQYLNKCDFNTGSSTVQDLKNAGGYI